MRAVPFGVCEHVGRGVAAEPTHSLIAVAMRRAVSGSLPVTRNKASRRTGEAVLGFIQDASSSTRKMTRLLPTVT